jgi:LmbE family N-acetylglucosaminyl deacetylase
VLNHIEDIQYALCNLLNEIKPVVVISFGPDGITHDWDHKMAGFATDFAFDLTDSGKLLLHKAHTESLIPISATSVDVSEYAINLPVNVSDYTDERIQSFNAHKGLYDITREVEAIVTESGIKTGMVNVYAQGATAAIMM